MIDLNSNQVLQHSLKFVSDIINENNGKLIIGISGPQGSGKTTISKELAQYVNDNTKFKAINISLDDFYLTFEQQNQLNQLAVDKYDNNALLKGRGLPGTHDLDILNELLIKFMNNEEFTVPEYDKSLHNGKGDRIPQQQWKSYDVDIIFLEGWFLGFKHINGLDHIYETSEDPVIKAHKLSHLKLVDEFLKDYEQVFEKCQYSIIIETDDIVNVYKWRLQQEHALILEKGIGMSDDEVTQFIDRYMPMYKIYYGELCNGGNSGKGKNLVIKIDMKRNVELTKIV